MADPAKQDESRGDPGTKASVVDEAEDDSLSPEAATNPEQTSESKKKKKKGKKKAETSESENAVQSSTQAGSKLTPRMVDSLLEMNPALKAEFDAMDKTKAEDLLKTLSISDLLTGMSTTGKNQKDMASYRFWNTQPVPRFDESSSAALPDGPIKNVEVESVAKQPQALMDGFEWCQLDLNQDSQLHEVYELLTYHYVEDDSAMFRFNYSQPFLNWALKSPDWIAAWHIGVRASKSQKLVASIFGIPVDIVIRGKTVRAVEINFLCVHKKLRSKRLAPILIREVTRRCNLEGIYQAVYTAGVVVPKPISTCRYFHRPLDWLKLHAVNFSPLPPHSTKARMVAKNAVPSKTSLAGLRPMTAADIPGVRALLHKYLAAFALAQTFSEAEIAHWFLNASAPTDAAAQVIWTYVVPSASDPEQIIDFVSFYCLESSVIKNEGRTDGTQVVRAAYLFYYATEAAFAEREKGYKERLVALVGDALVEAKKVQSLPFLPFSPFTAPSTRPPLKPITNSHSSALGQLRRLQRSNPTRQPPLPR